MKQSAEPIRRLAWVKPATRYSRSHVRFWRDGSLLYRRLFWRLHVVTATVDCSTTGGALAYVDPRDTGKDDIL